MTTWSPKDPHSVEFFAFDFSLLLGDGDSVASISSVTVGGPDSALVTGTLALDGSLVVAKLSGGTLGLTYLVRAEVLTTNGETLDLTATLLVRTQI